MANIRSINCDAVVRELEVLAAERAELVAQSKQLLAQYVVENPGHERDIALQEKWLSERSKLNVWSRITAITDKCSRLRHLETRRASNRASRASWYHDNIEIAREVGRNYCREHRDEIRAKSRAWRALHPGYSARWYRAHTEKYSTWSRAWYNTHTEKAREIWRRRRARVLGAAGEFTTAEFSDLCIAFGSRCAYCGEEAILVPDHTTPLSRGGANSMENILPACKHCNSSKGDKTTEEYLLWLKQFKTEEEGVVIDDRS